MKHYDNVEQVREAISPRVLDAVMLRRTMARLNEKPWCPKCGKKTSWKQRTEKGMCPSCYKVWSKPTEAEIEAAITDEHRDLIAKMEGNPAVKIVSELRRTFGDIVPGVKWDVTWMLRAKR